MGKPTSKRLLPILSASRLAHRAGARTSFSFPLAFPLACAALALAGCAGLGTASSPTAVQLAKLLPADAVLIGEQHDAPDHQRIEREAVEALAQRGQLAGLAIEMAEQGNDTTYLNPAATEAEVRTALSWNDEAWPWATYGAVAMAAVRAGAPVFGANLPRGKMKDAMADVSLDAQLAPPALAAQQQAVRDGHCGLLPESQIGPMTRVQVARDRAMAQTVAQARVQGKTVLLVSGAGHSTKSLGVAQMLPTDLHVRAVRLVAGEAVAEAASPGADVAGTPGSAAAAAMGPRAFDATWHTPPIPPRDYCAEFKRARG